MYKITIFIIFLLLPTIVMADAGYLGSVIQNPAPAITLDKYPDITLENEEVVIELHPEHAKVTAGFLFTNGDEEQAVVMYLPLAIKTIFTSALYAEFGDYKDSLTVLINGEAVETEGLYHSYYHPDYPARTSLDWESFKGLLGVINSKEPQEGEPLYFRKYYPDEDHPTYDDHYNYPLYSAHTLSASWPVHFNPHETKTVTCIYDYELTQDYGASTGRFAFPLYTGAFWAGTIGEGKIYVIPGDDFQWQDIRWVAGFHMPEVQELTDVKLDVALRGYSQKLYSHALLWSFTDFEPTKMDYGHLAFYPDIGSLGVYPYGESGEHLPESLIGSLIYILTSPFYQVDTFQVLAPNGVTFYQEPDVNAKPVQGKEKLLFLDTIKLMETEGDWMKAGIFDPFYEDGEWQSELKYSGWVNLQEKDTDGLILPTLIPLIPEMIENPAWEEESPEWYH